MSTQKDKKDGSFQPSVPTQRPLTVHIPAQWPAVGPKQVLHSLEDRLQLLLLPDLRLCHLGHIQLAVPQLFCRDKDKVMRQRIQVGGAGATRALAGAGTPGGVGRLSPDPWDSGTVLSQEALDLGGHFYCEKVTL